MAVYMLSYRLIDQTIGNRDYNNRYKALNDYLKKCSTTLWDDSTSFVVFETEVALTSILAECKKAIAPTHDLFLIRQVDHKTSYICGQVNDKSIFKLIPGLQTYL